MKYVPKMVQVHVQCVEPISLKRKKSRLKRRLPPFAQGTLVRLAHPLEVRETARVTRRHEAMVQHLDVRERQ